MNFTKTALFTVAALTSIGASADQQGNAVTVERGSKIYYTYCVSCHGISGEGDGRRAAKLEARPTDLGKTKSPAAAIEAMIRWGGESMGRSRSMPPWEDELSNENIKDVISFLNSLKKS